MICWGEIYSIKGLEKFPKKQFQSPGLTGINSKLDLLIHLYNWIVKYPTCHMSDTK